MNDPKWTDYVVSISAIVALVVSIVAAVISRRSAKASEASAKEAMTARKIAQADILSKHFDNVANFFKMIFEEIGREEQKFTLGKQSIESLKSFLSDDNELLAILNWMNACIDQVPYANEYYSSPNDPSYKIPQDATDWKKRFETKRREYLNIGQ